MCRMLPVLFASLVLSWVALAQEPAAPKVEEVLAKVQVALGAKEFTPTSPAMKATGKVNRYELEMPAELVIDGRGRFRTQADGLLGEIDGFDGKQTWTTDWSLTTRPVELQDRDLGISGTWLTTGYWAVRPDLFDITLDTEKTTDKEVALKIHRKDGHLAFTVFLDPTTWRPTRASGKLRDQEHVYTFADYSDGPGLKLPRRWTHAYGGVTTSMQYEKVEQTAATDDLFTAKPHPSKKASFDASKPGKLEVKKARSGHLLVKPTINGEDVGWFIFDSGAGHMVIDKKLAAKLELEKFGQIPVGGVGGMTKSPFCKTPSFELGPVTLKDQTYIELDLGMIGMALGEKIGGIVGYPFLQGAVIEIDCFEPAITLNDPAKYELPAGAAWRKLIIDGNHPIVEGKFDGDKKGWFRLDTGATDTVSFHTPAVKKHKLLEGRETKATVQGGVGGMVRSRAGHLEFFELADHRFEKPHVNFAQSEKGAFADEYLEGNIGQGFLGPFVLVFDYGNQRIGFVKKPGYLDPDKPVPPAKKDPH